MEPYFLKGGGRMGAGFRAFDWSVSELGLPAQWPQSLRTAVQIVIAAPLPTVLFWGEEAFCFYNDAYAALICGEEQQLETFGKPFATYWPESWLRFKNQVDRVFSTNDVVDVLNEPLPTILHQNSNNLVFTYSLSPLYNEACKPAGVLVTITKTAEANLNRNGVEDHEEDLHFALEAAQLGTWDYNPATNKFKANNRLKRWFGLLPEEEIDLSHAIKVIAKKDHSRVVAAIQRALQFDSGGYYNVEYTIVHPHTNEHRFVRAMGRAWFNENKIPYRFNGILQDVTSIAASRQLLEQSEQNLRNLILQAPMGICIVARETLRTDVVNDTFLALVGKERSELEQNTIWSVLQDSSAIYEPILKNVFESGIAFKSNALEVYPPTNTGPHPIFVNVFYEAIKNQDNAVVKVMIVTLDVTAQVTASMQLKEAEERARLSISAGELGTFEVDLLTNEIIGSPRLDEIFGVDQTNDRNRYVSALHPDDLDTRAAAYKRAFRDGNLEYEGRILNKSGAVQWVRLKGRVYFNEAGKPVRLLGVAQDITDVRLFQDELNNKVAQRTVELQLINRELERSNSNLEEFAHAASHDLKEPIRKIQFFTDKLKTQLFEKLGPAETHTLKRIETASQRMSALVNDLLEYSQVSDKPHQKEIIDLNVKLRNVLDDLELDINLKKAKITIEPMPQIKGYRRQLQQLFQNLIGNALKYHRPDAAPQIHIYSETVSGAAIGETLHADAPFYTHIVVADEGIGFDQNDAGQIFQVFTRLHGANQFEGTGIGLSIVRKVVENHNGLIRAESAPGQGAQFHVYLPIE